MNNKMNNTYYPDIFYLPEDNTLQTWESIFDIAVSMSDDVRFHKLVGFKRQSVYITYEEFKDIWTRSNFKHNVIIHRRGYESWKNFDNGRWCIEVGGCTNEYFIFVYLPESVIDILKEKFDLKVL